MNRRPAVAGAFYTDDPDDLRTEVDQLLGRHPRQPALATLAPHAGYSYSGPVAGAVYGRVAMPRDVVLVSFSHRGTGAPFAVWPDGEWETPLGHVPVAQDLCAEILKLPGFEVDTNAFAREHSGEVQVPFLQRARSDVRIAPISVQSHNPTAIRDAAAALARLLAGRDILLAATTDLTHCGADYGQMPPAGMTAGAFARQQDTRVLETIKALDVDGFWDVVRRHTMTMCGVAPTALLMEYSRARGARAATVVMYATSADREPDADRAVGYPGALVKQD